MKTSRFRRPMIRLGHSLVRQSLVAVLFLAVAFTLLAAVPQQSRGLSFANRVTYQRAIENVYWRHRLWPKERPDPKPSLDAVMTQAQLEIKVREYLCKSQALENKWQRPITANELQAEMDRMAQDTKQPQVLRELFAALGNDPYVIAECLARPLLAERLLNEARAHDQEGLVSRSGREAQDPISKAIAVAAPNYRLPSILDQPSECYDSWIDTSTTGALLGREFLTAVWTGSEMIVWGGYYYDHAVNTGGRYTPSTDSWTVTSTTNAPTGREWHTAVWTGKEMIVWGGTDSISYFDTGGRYNPSTDSWMATSPTGAPSARSRHTAVWTGSEMIVWGGYDGSKYFDTGGRYNPDTDAWRATGTTNVPTGRQYHTAVWTGSEMVVWGGESSSALFNTGGRYNPSSDSWTDTTVAMAPVSRYLPTAVWTGSEMIVWGGVDSSGGGSNTGGRYNSSTNTWTAITTTNAPTGRYLHTAVWTGSEMIVWGGVNDSFTAVNTGGRYNPGTDSWTATSTTNAPYIRFAHTAVWTGSEMIVWGGYGNGTYPDAGGRYCAPPPIALDAHLHRQQGKHFVLLTWTPADGGSVSILRNGVVIHITDDDGEARDSLGTQTGVFSYQVCDVLGCSNEVRVKLRDTDN